MKLITTGAAAAIVVMMACLYLGTCEGGQEKICENCVMEIKGR